MDAKDRWELGNLLEDRTQLNGLIMDWVAVRIACDWFNKQRKWLKMIPTWWADCSKKKGGDRN